ncbi:UDP-N-acetylmuramoyl-L-alanine--D-glutamate ligase [Salinicola acroporae]|uniref:UDP-N-acetylmuramoylalanine--D-glutamate ligase n=1 Tax=Salinicola acroporae TaxID=1541440 RepID=A0ABT6I7B6_9GAMM|nr:UDP-N-acetylmuramoyl-L-alanine--D-glutamate ligase [Salinicola acroporae]MDH4573566.1 UDP-N-acetylmuramoyl-L-alanine--D-glutamate ligase [Salinicola acroporae]
MTDPLSVYPAGSAPGAPATIGLPSTLVVGLGISGRAIARFLASRGERFMVADTRAVPPGLEAFRAAYPAVELHLGSLESLDLEAFTEIVVSPGVDLERAGLGAVRDRVVGEISLFARHCKAPIVAITGSNAKSTVTTLVGEMARQAGRRVAVGGNLGDAALDLLIDHQDAELFVLELSSFQLETLAGLGAACAAFLNLSADHLDRHGDMAGYRRAKARIFEGAAHAVVNADDAATWPEQESLSCERFTTHSPDEGEWGISTMAGETGEWLCHGREPLMPVGELRLAGRHNQANALAAMAIGHVIGIPWEVARSVLSHFAGLPHRGEIVAEREGVCWINDSKGTNVGATLAAIAGVGQTLTGKLVWLGGGVGKGADFTPLAEPLAHYAREAIVFGQDASQLAAALEPRVATWRVGTLAEAMRRAAAIAEPGDCVLLSPACASLDQFPNYLARGEAFRALLDQGSLGQGQEAAC